MTYMFMTLLMRWSTVAGSMSWRVTWVTWRQAARSCWGRAPSSGGSQQGIHGGKGLGTGSLWMDSLASSVVVQCLATHLYLEPQCMCLLPVCVGLYHPAAQSPHL